jgi:threonine aldolase
MTTLNRRRFVKLGSVSAGLGLAIPGTAAAAVQRDRTAAPSLPDDSVIRLSGDGLGLTPLQYARMLTHIADERGIAPDSYSLDGVVEQLEEQFARVLGKERAIFMPTGTLANHLAVRALAGGPSRVIVQDESHLHQDEGDCAQTLSNLTLMPLAPGRATFTADDVKGVIERTKSGRVASRVSVISIETPVRRKQGERFDSAEMAKIIALAREQGIRLHLDGARLFLQAAYTGESVVDVAKPFDTVYVSLYKYFNAASGAILAGPRAVLDGMYHTRRMFGGGLSSAWPFAAMALAQLEGFGERFGRAVAISEDVIRRLSSDDRFSIERVPLGTNLFRLGVRKVDATAFQKRLAARGVMLAPPQRDTFLVGVNETLTRTTSAQLTETLLGALA